jgi:hypothetical protein
MGNVITTGHAKEQWYDLIYQAQQSTDHMLDEELESYLVFLLMRYTKKPEMINQVLAKDYLKGLGEKGKLRHSHLRDVGDSCLIHAGLFPEGSRRKLVSSAYFVKLGRAAYHALGSRLSQEMHAMYTRLVETFVSLSRVLGAIRHDPNSTPVNLLDSFELWHDLGDRQSFQKLRALSFEAIPVYTPHAGILTPQQMN